jgi:hypothetical protein
MLLSLRQMIMHANREKNVNLILSTKISVMSVCNKDLQFDFSVFTGGAAFIYSHFLFGLDIL